MNKTKTKTRAKTKLPVVDNVEVRQRCMIEKFQCPGCTCGSDTTSCERFAFESDLVGGFKCANHGAGTFVLPGGAIALGLPKGFNKVGPRDSMFPSTNIRLYLDGAVPPWNRLNIPVWAMQEGGYTFVRTYAPRLNVGWVDVIENGPDVATISGLLRTKVRLHFPVDVAEFIEEID